MHEIFCVDRQSSDLVAYNVLAILNFQFIANIRILKKYFYNVGINFAIMLLHFIL